jgi:hypothetical protein
MKKTLTLGLALGFAVAGSLPGLAQAQGRDVRSYDGYCYMKQADAKRNGAIIGAVTGGLIGSQVSKHERGLGAIAGAVIGGAIGSNAGKNSAKCYNGEYYSYQGKYYDPPSAPSGYVPVFYEQRPPERLYSHVYYDRDHHDGPPPYGYGNAWNHGWRDSNGRWHDGQPPHGYRQDNRGYWRR